jgi:predicted Zn-dependent peptidase
MATPLAKSSQAAEPRGAVPPLGPERPVIWPARTHTKLGNGLEVVLLEHHAIPKFSGELFFRTGNATVAERAPGLASITAAVARTGTTQRTSRQIEEDLRRMGADLSASAGADTSVIAFAGLAECADGLLGLVSELAREASFPADEFERERRQMLEEVRIERATPGFLATERLRKTLFGAHPYAQMSPSEKHVAAYRLEELVETYRAAYRPGNSLLILLGDFRAKEMLARVERIFGRWEGAKPDRHAVAAPPALRGRAVCLVDLPGAVQAQILVGRQTITRKHPDWIRLGVANAIYGGAFNSRLVMNIREAKGYSYSPRSSVTSFHEHGYFSIHAAVRNEVVAATLAEIFYELERLRALPVPQDELDDARNYLTGVFSLGLATQDAMLGQLANVYLHELPEDYLEMYRERVRTVSAEGVLVAARTYFDSPNARIVVVGDRRSIESQAALWGEMEVFDAQGNQLE